MPSISFHSGNMKTVEIDAYTYERLKDYANDYFGGSVADAIRYCFEECESLVPQYYPSETDL